MGLSNSRRKELEEGARSRPKNWLLLFGSAVTAIVMSLFGWWQPDGWSTTWVFQLAAIATVALIAMLLWQEVLKWRVRRALRRLPGAPNSR